MRDQSGKSAEEGEVSSCVSNLIHAFTDGLNVFKRLRERRRKRKSKQQKEREEGCSGAELQLSDSLRKGPVELKEKYESCYGEKGEKFAKGDAIAHASLVETLIKFNTGLVRIIATFLHHDSKSSDLTLDYKSLTSLSDSSRREAIDSMNRLYQRLSQSQVQLHRKSEQKAEPEKKNRSPSRSRSQGPTVRRVSISGTSKQTQLAMVRPRNARKGSTSSSSSYSSKTASTSTNSPWSTPPRSPLPEYSPKDPFPPSPPKAIAPKAIAPKATAPKATAPKATTSSTRKSKIAPEPARPTTWPQPKATKSAPFTPLPTPLEYLVLDEIPPHLPPAFGLEKPNFANHAIPRRRAVKDTPSTYTFLSDSTKLGEIPQRNWTLPFDYEEAARLNAEAAVKGYPVPTAAAEQKTRGRKTLRSLFKKQTA